MFEHPLSIQSIAKWFEDGCSQTDNGNNNSVSTCPKSSEESSDSNNTFHILECTDICLLSKLSDVKSQTLLDRAQKQLQAIEELPARKDRLLTISSELLVDGRRSVALGLLTDEIDTRSQLFCSFPSELLFQRAHLYLKSRQLPEALSDLYLALKIVDQTGSGGTNTDENNNNMLQHLDQIHVHILEEIKKYLTSSNEADTKQIIFIANIGNVSFEQVLKQYDAFVSKNVKQQQQQLVNLDDVQSNAKETEGKQEISKEGWPKIDQQMFFTSDENQSHSNSFTSKPTYKSMLIDGGNKTKNKEENETIEAADKTSNKNESPNSSSNNFPKSKTDVEDAKEVKPEHHFLSNSSRSNSSNSNNSQNLSSNNKQSSHYYEINYFVKLAHPKKETVKVQKTLMIEQHPNNLLVDNIFNMRALLVEKLVSGTDLSTITQIFGTFGTIVNAQFLQMGSAGSVAALVEYDNADSPRLAISYLSEVSLPYVGQGPEQSVSFRFYRSSGQLNLRICKENQVRSSKECYFWRTTGCKNAKEEGGGGCKFYHNPLAKGVDFQEWMTFKQQNGPKQQLKNRFSQNAEEENKEIGKNKNMNNHVF